jgi:hypothetical protein
LASTLLAELSQEQMCVQDHRYNYPLPAHYTLPDEARAKAFEEIRIVHYHFVFTNLYWMDDLPVSEPFASWLTDRLPLPIAPRLTRSSVLLYTAQQLSRLPFRRQHRRIVSRIPGIRKSLLNRAASPLT